MKLNCFVRFYIYCHYCGILSLLAPLSSLLAIGRVPLVNVMERRPLPPAPTPCSYKLTSHDSGDIDCITSDPHFEPTVFLHNGYGIKYM